MGSFRFPVEGSGWTAALGEVELPEAARYPGATLHTARITAGAGFRLLAPVTGESRALGTVDAGPAVYELAPVPFPIARALRACCGGCPTFYFGVEAHAMPTGFVNAGDELIAAPDGSYHLGVMFQDRISLDPWAWIKILDDAMGTADASTEEPDPDRVGWAALATALPRGLRVYEASGTPSSRAIELRAPDGTITHATGPGSIALPPGGPIEVRLADVPASARPIFSLYLCDPPATITTTATAADDLAPATFTLPAGTRGAVLQIADLDAWLSVRPADAPAPLPRYHAGSRTEPFVDGNAAFAKLVDDLRHAAQPDGGAQLAGLQFRDFPLIEGDETSALVLLLQAIGAATHVPPPLLTYKFLNLSDPQWTQLQADADGLAIGAGISLIGATFVLVSVPDLYKQSDTIVTIVLVAVQVIAGALVATIVGAMPRDDFRGFIEGLQEPSLPISSQVTTIWSRYPAAIADNPLAGDPAALPLGLENVIDHFGAWHQKIQLIRRHASDSDETLRHVGWVGGMDIDPTRIDDPGHRGKPYAVPTDPLDWSQHPFHDVHARITGPAAADLFQTWEERYVHELTVDATLPGRSIETPPTPASLAVEGGTHIVQIGRTYFKPGPHRPGFAFAPGGEATTNDTLVKAILQAQHYIYIEDQYFTPPGEPSSDPTARTETIVAALVASASTGSPDKKLVVVQPSENDQPFGEVRRRHLYSLLSDAWGERAAIGCVLRPPLLPPAGTRAHEGRCFLLEALGETEAEVHVGPLSRVPAAVPFWLWVDGELMLCTSILRSTEGDIPGCVLQVYRGHNDDGPRTRAAPRAHRAGAPVTLAQLKSIYIHAKVVIVDDVFVSIGSSNLNRRGMYHDGEITSFTIPQTLLALGDNPARVLRTRLWAEHLGIPPEMGGALLADVPAAFELWRRAFFAGNRFVPVDYARTRATAGASLGGSDGTPFKTVLKTGTFVLAATGAVLEETVLDELWNKVVDPTSGLERDARPSLIAPDGDE